MKEDYQIFVYYCI